MVAYTTLLQLRKPTVGGDPDLWGGYLNDGADIIDLLMTVAKDYPVTRASIDAIRKRKTWKHI